MTSKGTYDEDEVDELLTQLSPEELEALAREVDPDVSLALFALSLVLFLPLLLLLICISLSEIVQVVLKMDQIRSLLLRKVNRDNNTSMNES